MIRSIVCYMPPPYVELLGLTTPKFLNQGSRPPSFQTRLTSLNVSIESAAEAFSLFTRMNT